MNNSTWPLQAVFSNSANGAGWTRPVVGWDEDGTPLVLPLDGKKCVNAEVFAESKGAQFVSVDQYSGHIVSSFAAAAGTTGFVWGEDEEGRPDLYEVPVIGWSVDNWGNTHPVTINCRETSVDSEVFAIMTPQKDVEYLTEIPNEEEFRQQFGKLHRFGKLPD